MRGAFLEVLGDAFGSVAAIVAGLIIVTPGFDRADSIASLVIAGTDPPARAGRGPPLAPAPGATCPGIEQAS